MSVQIKVVRLLGSVLVMLALVPWLGISPAAATGGGTDKWSSAAQGHGNNAKDEKAGQDEKAASSAKSDEKSVNSLSPPARPTPRPLRSRTRTPPTRSRT